MDKDEKYHHNSFNVKWKMIIIINNNNKTDFWHIIGDTGIFYIRYN